ncbi:site-specific integrase [bacterium]|nr:site-specific integrase [bacterium]MBQ9149438.1 site-specific integrase [bacterium]
MSTKIKGNNSKWYYRFQINGKEYSGACKGATNKKEADKYEAIIKSEVMKGNLGILDNKPKPKLKEVIPLYLTYSKTNKKSHKGDVFSTKIFIKYFGNIELNEITPQLIEDFKTKIKADRNNKNATINRHLEALSKMLNIAVANNLLDKNPMWSVKKLKENNYKIRVLLVDEEKRLFEEIERGYEVVGRDRKKKIIYPYLHLRPLIICALQTGMRRGEIFNLKWKCIDFEYEFIELLETKSGKSRRVPISSKLMEVLNSLSRDSEYVFVNQNTGEPYNDIKNSFHTVLKKANIENFRFHDFRHTAATRMLEKGADIRTVQEILGHSSVVITQRYTHSTPQYKKKAIELLCA